MPHMPHPPNPFADPALFSVTRRTAPHPRPHPHPRPLHLRPVAFPYWDFLIDADLGDSWASSPIYQNSWFGAADTYSSDDYRVRGRFRDVEKLVDVDHEAFPDAEHR